MNSQKFGCLVPARGVAVERLHLPFLCQEGRFHKRQNHLPPNFSSESSLGKAIVD